MRHIEIDFSGKVPRITDKYAGEKGEHQAVTLDVIPEAAMSSDEDLAFYYLLFKVEGGLVASRTFNQGEDISVALWGQLTENRNVVFQLIGTNGLETIIAKSPIITLYLGESLEGTVIGIDDNRDSLIAMIGAFNERLTDDEEVIASLVSGSQSDWEQDDPTALDYIKHKPIIPEVKYEELNRNGILLKYNYQQIAEMWENRIPMCFESRPIVYVHAIGTNGYGKIFRMYQLYATYDIYTYESTYQIIQTHCYDAGQYARIGSSIIYPFAPIHKIKKADGTELSIRNDLSVILPDYALASALANYYLKTETYSKEEVNNLISGVGGLNIEIVNSLPSSGEADTIYFVPKTGSTNDTYDEYMWISNAWEHIGSTDVDLSNYYTKSEVNALIPTDTGDLTNNAGFITSAGVKYVEVCKSTSPQKTNYTGDAVLAYWQAGIPMCFNGFPIIGVVEGTDNNVFVMFFKSAYINMQIEVRAIPKDSETYLISVSEHILNSYYYNQLSGGQIVADNNKFVTGGQVYSEGYLKSIPTASTSVLGGVKVDGTSITIADGVISAQGSSLPSGTNEGDILYWHNSAWSVGGIDNVIQNGNNLSY